MTTRRLVLLIHGVGGTEAGALYRAVREHAPHLGAGPSEVHEYHWNSLVERPRDLQMGEEYVSSLIGGIIGSAMVDVLPRPASILRAFLFGLLAVAPILTIWGVLLAINSADALTPDPWRPVVIPLSFLLIPAFVMFRSLLVHSYATFGLVAAAWTASLIAVSALYALVCGLKGPRQLLAALRTITLGCLWLPVGVLGYLSTIPRFFAWIYFTFALIAFTIGIEGSDSSQIIAPTLKMAGANWLRITITATLVAAAVLSLAGFVRQVLAPIFKVLSDILRYIGDPVYRAAIQKGVDDCFYSGALHRADVYLVGHSLGSVIAVHALIRKNSPFDGAGRITLITLGSPLYRFFARFFANIMPSPDELSFVLAQRFPGFRWINIYRPWDPIGTGLFRNSFPAARDICTRQWWRILIKAHTDYWSDPHVANCVRDCLTATSDDALPPAVHLALEPFSGSVGERRLPSIANDILIRLILFGPVVLMFVNYLFTSSYLEARDYRETIRTVEEDPVDAVVEVHTREVLRPNGNGLRNASYPTYITWPNNGSKDTCRTSGPDCEEDTVDSEVAAHLRSNPHIRYRRGNPRVYYPPGYEPRPPGIFVLIGYTVWCIVLMFAWFLVAERYVDRLLSFWLGELSG